MATPIIIPLTADLKGVKTGLAETESRLKKFSKRAGGILKGAVKGFAGVGIVAAAAATGGIQEFAQLDEEVREVLTLSGGDVTNDAVAGLTDRISSIATEYGQAAEDVAGSFYDSISAGIDASAVDSFVEDAAELATAGGTTIGAAVDILTSATNAFGMSAEDADKISDTLFGTVKAGKTTIDEISAAFSQVGPVAAATGVSLEDVSSWLGALTLSGTPTKQAATQIKAALAELSKPASKMSEAFEGIAGKTFPEFVQAGGSLAEALEIMGQAGKDVDGGMVTLFGSIEAYQGVLGVTGNSAELFAGTLETVTSSAGATDEAFQTMSAGAAFSFAQLQETLDVVLRDIGAAVLPAVQELVPAITPLIELLGEGLADIAIGLAPVIEQLIAGLVPAVERLIPPLLDVVTALLPTLADLLVAILPLIVPIAEILGDVLVIAAEALGVAIRFITTGIELLMDWLGPLLEQLSELTGSLVDHVQPAMEGLIESSGWAVAIWEKLWEVLKAIGEWFRDVFVTIWSAIGDEVVTVIGAISTAITGTLGVLIDIVKGVVDYFTRVWLPRLKIVFEGAGKVFTIWWDVVKAVVRYFTRVWLPRFKIVFEALGKVAKAYVDLFRAQIKILLTVANNIVKFFRNYVLPGWKKVWDVLKAPVKVVRDTVKSLYDLIVNTIGKISRLISKAKNIPGVKTVAGGIGKAVSGIGKAVGSVLGLAEGGLVKRPTFAVVGEAGPELVLPLDRFSEILGYAIPKPVAQSMTLPESFGEAGPELVLPLDRFSDGGKGETTTVYNTYNLEVHDTLDSPSAIGERVEQVLQAWSSHNGGLNLNIARR